jgi:ubiquinone/menaquinone biosynthesis C-methylase UbiE
MIQSSMAPKREDDPVNKKTHQNLILDQFTRQAAPFSAAAMIKDEAVLRLIVEAASPQSDDTLLDVACGPGLVACALAAHVRLATGIDLTPAMLEEARKAAAQRCLRNVALDHGDVYALPYDDNTFSIVIARYAFHHLLDPFVALREMARVCGPAGRILVVDAYAPEDPTQAAEYNRIERLRDPSRARALSLPELATLFSRCGLGQLRITRYGLPVELKDLLAHAFPNPGDEAEIAEVFAAAAVDGRLGIPVRRQGEAIHIAYQAANPCRFICPLVSV